MFADRPAVALRKESVDRNIVAGFSILHRMTVALRKESVDRNVHILQFHAQHPQSLSARRAWIEITKWFSNYGRIHNGRSPQGERG